MSRHDAVLMVGFGGPTSPGHSEEFVRRVTGDRPGMDARIAQVARHYDELGGISPYNERTFAQARALASYLSERGSPLPVEVGMRFWNPLIAEVVRRMAGAGCRRAVGFILSPHRSAASWDKYRDAVAEAMKPLEGGGFEVDYLDSFHLSTGFIEAIAANVTAAAAELGPRRFERAKLIFTAHSVPEPVARDAPYVPQFAETATAVAAKLGRESFALAYQSAAGGRVPWLGPDISTAILTARDAGAADVVVVPIGFLCDHVEVLYDLDIVARETARAAGVGFVRPKTVESHPSFISAIGEQVLAKLAGA